jgi:hypothetical protein
MVKIGRLTLELVAADTKIAFKEHTKDGKTYVEVEPDVEYFIRVGAEAGPEVVKVRLYVDGKNLGYWGKLEAKKKNVSRTFGLWSYDGSRSSERALIFAKAKVFNRSNSDQEAPFWTGKVEAIFWSCVDTGETYIESACKNKWETGDIGVVIGQSDPALKGVMTQEGNLEKSHKDSGKRRRTTRLNQLPTVTLHYCSAAGLMAAGVFGPVDRMVMARRLNEYKRGATQVAADAANMPKPQKLQMVQMLNGKSIGPAPKECDLFDLTNLDDDEEDDSVN